jgi:hypothetical protein
MIVRIEGIASRDIVKASIGGRVFHGEVLEFRDRTGHLQSGLAWGQDGDTRPRIRSSGPGARRADGARGRRGGDAVVQPPEQLALPIST